MANRYYTPMELARALDVTRQAVYRWIQEGRIEAYRVGPKLIRIPEDEFDRLTTRRPVVEAADASEA